MATLVKASRKIDPQGRSTAPEVFEYQRVKQIDYRGTSMRLAQYLALAKSWCENPLTSIVSGSKTPPSSARFVALAKSWCENHLTWLFARYQTPPAA
ncbi:hypothetical protein PoB_001625500 [Plakobranchus ocellatus]|uniref:Uncharacterized protein n=1 Tax=Plakobranchus ocellatus TaxID=259542 RepID=A0AAV3Z2X2_9GAST|nr:hypothetical protein PoB_001625500 [Plakobranchus ocellatus]